MKADPHQHTRPVGAADRQPPSHDAHGHIATRREERRRRSALLFLLLMFPPSGDTFGAPEPRAYDG